ncbi:MAG: bifunctional 5,10-methylenetetrahydrofolate dehydrogenase/5,10-methenyltetrahydrofolate cyclohydrolase [Parasporobacterium sp.]|nr:bifunctional 5,10-methylenetetrahydrofolate dehydrogenase/5,10-methenyltetrahydrofolate cyclohydrolase [Parasporobacterium sp.]
MATIIKGADAARKIKEDIRTAIDSYSLSPCMAIIRVGSKDSDIAYERGIRNNFDSLGIRLQIFEYPETICQEELEQEIIRINGDPDIHGILVFRPLPHDLDESRIASLIDPAKDMDCMCPASFARLVMQDPDGYAPCTAEAVIRLCEYAGVEFDGARAVVIGRSLVIGKPVGLLLLSRNATVTWCHSHTKDLARMCEDADILVSACGSAGLVTEEIAQHISPSCVAVDVGINFKDGKMCGDFDFEAVSRFAASITPVPGGVGAVTNTVLAAHVVRAACKAVTGQSLRL